MKKYLLTLFVILCGLISHAQRRYYLIRAGELPTDKVCYDLRPDENTVIWTLNNIYSVEQSRYALFTKRADSWWQVMTETAYGRHIDWSEVDASWSVVLKIRRTVDYPLTLVLGGVGTANGYTLTTAMVPADGEWRTLTIPLSSLPALPDFSDRYAGRLLQIHSDLGYAGDEVGIDYCYLTDDPSEADPGTVQPPKRYYFITNAHTPLNHTPYAVEDYSARMETRSEGWLQWSYIPYPYYSMNETSTAKEQLIAIEPIPMPDVTSDWVLMAQVRTDITTDLTIKLYLPDGRAFTDTISTADMVTDGKTWNRIFLPLQEMTAGMYGTTNDGVFFSIGAEDVPAGLWAIGSLMLTNDWTATDPDPHIPGDPSQQTRIYLIHDGTPLPEQMTCVDYRLFYTNYLSVSYGNNTTRNENESYLTLLPTNGWWSADISAASTVDLTAVNADWTLHTRIKTTSAYRPINLIFYKTGNAQLSRYQLTDALLPVSSNGEWYDFDIPMSDILGSETNLPSYNASRIFSFHSDNGGTAGVEVSMEYMYLSKQGESRPDPQPGLEPVEEPTIDPMPEPVMEGIDEILYLSPSRKFLHNGKLFIQRSNTIYTPQGLPISL